MAKKIPKPIRARRATPPTAPPTIAPIGGSELCVSGVGVAVGVPGSVVNIVPGDVAGNVEVLVTKADGVAVSHCVPLKTLLPHTKPVTVEAEYVERAVTQNGYAMSSLLGSHHERWCSAIATLLHDKNNLPAHGEAITNHTCRSRARRSCAVETSSVIEISCLFTPCA